MPEARVIKKYPNRRLYDTEESRYIKLADVRTLVLSDVRFVIVDKKTGGDITRSILLQVISEEEQQGEPIMSRRFLSQVIRAHGCVPAASAAGYLEQCLDAYVRRQDGARGRAASVAVAEVPQVRRGRWTTAREDARRQVPGGREGRLAGALDGSLREDRKKAG